MSARVLVVDDEERLRRTLTRSLEGHGYIVLEADDGSAGLVGFETFKPDVVLLDLMLPDMSGVDVCRELRSKYGTPIIVLSALGEERTKVSALDAGADDYLTKPFGMNELLARIRVALRRDATDGEPQPVISTGGLVIDLERRTVTLDGREVRLTPTEYRLLNYLAVNAGKVLTHPMILREVWGEEYADRTQLLRPCVNQIRVKLGDDPAEPRFIRTDPGVGYRFVDEQVS
jgi:two-component system, OmpR family, KDP operon response regulator KdpE